jgi:hypothetical protein
MVAQVVAAGHPHPPVGHRQFTGPGAELQGLAGTHLFMHAAGLFNGLLCLRVHHQSPGVDATMIGHLPFEIQ